MSCCIVSTPNHPTAVPNQSITPEDAPANTPHNTTPPPTLEDLVEPTMTQTSPPQPQNDNTPTQPCPSPISEDPSTATFPTSQISSCLHDFCQQYLTSFNTDIPFKDFELLTSQFTSEAVELTLHLLPTKTETCPPSRRPDRPSARPAVDYCRPLSIAPATARRLQHLYCVSKKHAARKIFDDSPGFDGTLDDATRFFIETFGL